LSNVELPMIPTTGRVMRLPSAALPET